MRAAAARLAILIAAVCVALLLCEGAVRLFVPQPLLRDPDAFEPDPVRIARLRPGFHDVVVTTEFRSTWTINADGHRGPRAGERGPAAYRIAALGDSFTFGYGVEEEQAWPRRLEAMLNEGRSPGRRVEVLNLGIGGYGTWQEAALLDEICARWKPDLALVAFYIGNDPQDNTRTAPAGETGARQEGEGTPAGAAPIEGARASLPSRAERLKRWLGGRSQLYNLVATRADDLLVRTGARRLVYPFEMDILRPGATPEVARAWEDTRRALARLADVARRHDVRLVLLLVPMKHQVSDAVWRRLLQYYGGLSEGDGAGSFDRERPQRMLAGIATGEGIELLDLLPALREDARAAGDGSVLYWPRDQHWTARGHEAAARAIRSVIRRPPSP